MLYTIYIRKKKKTVDPFVMKHLIPSVQNFKKHHLPSPSPTFDGGAPVGLNDFFSQETHGRRNSSRLGFHRIVRSSAFPPKNSGRQPPNIPIGCCSREASCWAFYKVKTEDLGCVLCKTKKDIRIKHTHSAKSHSTVLRRKVVLSPLKK